MTRRAVRDLWQLSAPRARPPRARRAPR